MEDCGSGSGRVEGLAAAQVPELCRRHLGAEGGGRPARTRRPAMEENRMILAGEIGGTHARLAAFETEGSKLNCVIDTVFESQQHTGLAEIVAEFVKTNGVPVDSACFGVAGPVRHGRCKISNLSWIIDSRELAKQ